MELGEQLASFETLIETLQIGLSPADISGPIAATSRTDSSLDTEQIAQQATQLSAQFQEIITTLSSTPLHPRAEQQLGTYQTEAHRRLRLIGIEAMRLNTARQPASISRGRSQLYAHIRQLQQFVQAMRATIDDIASPETANPETAKPES